MVYLPHWPVPSTLGSRKIDPETVFERMKKVLSALDNPHQKLPPVIHVTGTNGKGSTVAFLKAIFVAAGYSVHTYTSPHLHDCNERIELDSEKISNEMLFEVMEETRLAAGATPLTFFEGFTVGALLAFSRAKADLLIMEVGLGARIDATNVIDAKLATVITSISPDHTEYLGNEIAEIAWHKSHIMRSQVPCIVAAQSAAAIKVIERVASELHSPLIRFGKEFQLKINCDETFELECGVATLHLPKPALLGEHQYINSATAIACALAINDQSDFRVDEDHIQRGLASVNWPSRIERIKSGLTKLLAHNQSELWIDGAHNVSGANALASWIKERDKKERKLNFLIFGFSIAKCRSEFLAEFADADGWCAVKVEGEPYPESAERIAEIGSGIGLNIVPKEDLLEAAASLGSCNQPCRIVICGSLHLARDAKKYSNF